MSPTAIAVASWTGTALLLIARLFILKKNKLGWLLDLTGVAAWLVVAVATQQWALLVSQLFFGVLDVDGYFKWRQQEKTSQTTETFSE